MPDKKSPTANLPIPVQLIERRIYLIRGQKVMLDSDLAELYQVTTGNLNLAVRRNSSRFPEDFMFQLTKEEANSLLLQFARAKTGRGGRQTSPYAFTEQGVAMLSSVLNSERAVQINIIVMRAFVGSANCWPPTRIWPAKSRSCKPIKKTTPCLLPSSPKTCRPSPKTWRWDILALQGLYARSKEKS
jgi:hypothetical protein